MKTLEKQIRNPATGEVLQAQKEHSAEELQHLVQRSRLAQEEWAALKTRERCRALLRIRTLLTARAEELARVVSSCTGKPFLDAFAAELLPGLISLTYYRRKGEAFLKPRRLGRSSPLFVTKRTTLYREPLGVVGVISPWNYPFAIPFQEIVMALVAGNGVVLKVATQVQPVGDAIASLLADAGLPEGLFGLAHVPGKIAGDAFLDAGVDKIFFTGSVAVGKELMTKAAATLTPLCLELGGNDPMIVCEDANLVRAVYGAMWGGLSNAGQSCAGVERIYVQRGVYDRFVRLLAQKVGELRIGHSKEPDIDIGSLTVPEQLAEVKLQVADALEKGAVVLAEAPAPVGTPGLFHRVLVLGNTDPSMRLVREETFGPVLTVDPFDTDEEAVDFANDTRLGLSASVWTKDRRRAAWFAARFEAGNVMINDHLVAHGMAEVAWGGYKDSGYGRTHGRLGLEEMTRVKTVVEDTLPGMHRTIWWHPYDASVTAGLLGAMRFLFGKKKLRGLAALLRLFFGRMRRPR